MTKTCTTPFTLSIEPANGRAFQHGFHLGTDGRPARQIAEEKFHARNNHGMPTVTVALMRNGRMVDCYDGEWSNSRGACIPSDETTEIYNFLYR